ncbi:MAG: hypothetical protein R3B91_22180 [Planctomycetaceae bacterium]
MGQNPSTTAAGTTPGSFAKPPVIAPGVEGAYTFASPDTPGMPEPSDKTAWDFLPEGWESEIICMQATPIDASHDFALDPPDRNWETVAPLMEGRECVGGVSLFSHSGGVWRAVFFPESFQPNTQLEYTPRLHHTGDGASRRA